jgi:hypothetical protein
MIQFNVLVPLHLVNRGKHEVCCVNVWVIEMIKTDCTQQSILNYPQNTSNSSFLKKFDNFYVKQINYMKFLT